MPRPRFDRLDPQRRAAILEEAAAEFVAHGYHDASINRVQKALGLSKGAFYYWFDDKEDLFVAVLRQQLQAMAEAVGGLLVGPPSSAPLWTQLEHSIRELIVYVAETPDALALYKAALTLQPAVGSPVGALLADSLASTEALIEEGRRRGDVRTDLPAAMLAHVAHGMLEGLDRYALTAEQLPEGSPGALAAVYVSLLEAVLAPPP